MFKRFLIAVVLAITCTPPLNAQSDWFKLEPVGAGFSVMMPGKPGEQVKARDDFVSRLFMVRTTSTTYVALYGDYAPSIRIDVQKELVANRDNFLTSVEARLTDSKEITLKGRAGLEFTGESGQALFRSRIYLFGNRFHQITVVVFKGHDDSANVNRFFSSFSFTDQERSKP